MTRRATQIALYSLENGVKTITAFEELPLVHIQFEDLVSNPVESVKYIYSEHNIKFDDALETSIVQFKVENSKIVNHIPDRRKRAFGINPDELESSFRLYLSYLSKIFPDAKFV